MDESCKEEWTERLKEYGSDWATMEAIWHGGMAGSYRRSGNEGAARVSATLALLAMQVAKLQLEGISTNEEAAVELVRRTESFYLA
tara:strand:- start:309 stop:566 length:258 start_codon:yes stop_codon:yes gene_type:complete